MMNPVTSFTTPTAPLVNTPVPGSLVARVPYDNVAPSVSSAQIDSNARGNQPRASTPAPAQPDSLPDSGGDTPAIKAAASGTQGSQVAFIAQLASQDGSPQAQLILVQYEKLVTFSNVKYKPSNALRPSNDPSGLFGQLLRQQQEQPAQAEETAQTPTVEKQDSAPQPALPAAVNDLTPAPVRGLSAYSTSLSRPNLLAEQSLSALA